MPFYPRIAAYNHCTCVEFFAYCTCFGILDMVQNTCLWDTNCWLLTIKVNNYQSTALREWISFHVLIVWLLVSFVVSINCMLLIAVKS